MFTFINEDKMPKFLSRDHFRIWLQKVNKALALVGPGEEAPKFLNVEFSDTEKTVIYGTMTLDEIKKEIRNLWETTRRVEDILNQLLAISSAGRVCATCRMRHRTVSTTNRATLRKILIQKSGPILMKTK